MKNSNSRKPIEHILKSLEHRADELHIIEATYKGNKQKATFVDKIHGEFTAIVRDVVVKNQSHPSRKMYKTKQTNIAKYGGPSPFSSKDTHDKSRETMLLRYGVEKPLQNKESQDKFKQTSMERFGTEHPFQSEVVKDKICKSILAKYGVDNYFKTMTKYTLQDGTSFSQLCLSKGVPKSYATALCQQHGLDYAVEYVNNYDHASAMTDIESRFSLSTGVEFFNKHPNPLTRHKPDFKVTDTVYVDLDGLYWHSELIKADSRYHFNKRKVFEDNKLQLLQFRADEVHGKINIIKSMLVSKSGNGISKVHARKTQIKQVPTDSADKFLTDNHLMGYTKAKHMGLYLEDMLVCMMSYKTKLNTLKIERFCNILDHTVVGGFSKLLKAIELANPTAIEVHNWVDLRYGTGRHLESKGFVLARETLGWKWTDFNNTYNRLRCRANMDSRKLSEREHAKELGLAKIYDAGQRLFIKQI